METTQKVLDDLRNTLVDAYSKQLDSFGPMMKPKVKGTLIDGFKDGVNAGISHTVKMLEVTVKE